jgi:hypothetical protein
LEQNVHVRHRQSNKYKYSHLKTYVKADTVAKQALMAYAPEIFMAEFLLRIIRPHLARELRKVSTQWATRRLSDVVDGKGRVIVFAL